MCLNLKAFAKMVNFLSLTAVLSQISWVQKLGPRPPALAWLWLSHSPGQAKAHLRPKVRPGLAFGLRPEPAHHYPTLLKSNQFIMTPFSLSLSLPRQISKFVCVEHMQILFFCSKVCTQNSLSNQKIK